MIVEVTHPTLVAHVQARARTERTDLVALRTSVTLKAVSADAMDPVDLPLVRFLRYAGRVRRHDGSLWQALDAPGATARAPMSADAFAAWLSGDGPGTDQLARRFSGTPLVARLRNPGPAHFDLRPLSERAGLEVDLDASRRIVHDTRARAVEGVRAYLDREVLIADGIAHVRLNPLLLVHAQGGRDTPAGLAVQYDGFPSDYHQLFASPRTAGAMLDLLRGRKAPGTAEPSRSAEAEAWLAGGFGEDLYGEEHRLVANGFPGAVRRLVEYARNEPSRHADRDALDGHLQVLCRLELDAVTGLAGHGDPGPALVAMAGAIAAVREGEPRGPIPHGCDLLRSAIEDLYLPTLPGHALPAEDAEALALFR